MSKAGYVAKLGLIIAVALVLSYVERLIPFNFGIPGVKLGLSNLAIIMALYTWGAKEAFLINCARIILAGFMFGSLASLLYSLSGGLLSYAAMCLGKKSGAFSVIGVSVAGGIAHNLGQILIAGIVVSNLKIIFYLPVLIIAGLLTGLLIGIISRETIKRIKKAY